MESQNVQEIIEGYYCHHNMEATYQEGLTSGKEETKNDFEMSRDEFEQITKAFKDEKFRQLLADYVEEVRDPENQLIYQQEMTQLERERGNVVHFINPRPGYVLKTSINGEIKGFINICSNTLIRKPDFESCVLDNKKGSTWSLPYTQSPGRDDLDKSGKKCKVYDVIFNPVALILASKNTVLQTKLEQTVLDAVEKSFSVKIDRVNLKKPKLSYKGPKAPIVVKYKIGSAPPAAIDTTVIGKESPPLGDKNQTQWTEKSKANAEKCNKNITATVPEAPDYTTWTTPKYSLKYRSHVDIQDYSLDSKNSVGSTTPDEIQVLVDLPMLSSSKALTAEVIEDGHGFELISDTKALYYLKIKFPYQADPDSSKATFDKEKRKLSVVVKVVKKPSFKVQMQNSLDEKFEDVEESDEIFDEKPPRLVSILSRTESSDNNSGDEPSATSASLGTSVGSVKKTVRFNDEIQRQIYRSNSSILGQRKKNQRKSKNKKKQRERLYSGESVSSMDEHEFDNGPQSSNSKSNPRPILGGRGRQRFSSGDSLGSGSSFDDTSDYEPSLPLASSPIETIHELNCDN